MSNTDVSITLDRDEQELARQGKWDWIHDRILSSIPKAPPAIKVGLKFFIDNPDYIYSVTSMGPDVESPRKVIMNTGEVYDLDTVLERFLSARWTPIEEPVADAPQDAPAE